MQAISAQADRRPAGVDTASVDTASARSRDALLLPAMFVLNCLFFSQWYEWDRLAAEPGLLLVWVYGLLLLVPLLWRNVAPIPVFVIEWLLTVAAWPIMPLFTPVTGMPMALYALSCCQNKRTSLVALVSALLSSLLCATVSFRLYADPGEQFRQFVANAVVLSIVTLWVWSMGRVTRAGRRRFDQLERERRCAVEAVADERRRIARELHDVVSHAVTVIVLQAAGARRIADGSSDEVSQALRNIEVTGKQAMSELRRLLGVLKAGELAADRCPESALDLVPTPALADIPVLIDRFRAVGVRVVVLTEGQPRTLDPSVELVGYRIVQEGLTNILKHGGDSPEARLYLLWGHDTLRVELRNQVPAGPVDGRPESRSSLSLGVGLIGLRERVTAAGGWLRAGRGGDGAFKLVVALPSTDLDDRLPSAPADRLRRPRRVGPAASPRPGRAAV